MAVWALGLNHATAPLDVRSRFAFGAEQIGVALHALRGSLAGEVEAAILSTCNRTEVYCAGEHNQMTQTLAWLSNVGRVSAETLRSHSYVLQGEHAARHAFRVASGLDSMVLGEPQILGQMKNAVRAAADTGALGTTLNQLFQRSFSVAKEVRTTTEIGAHSISMAAAAVRLSAQLFEDLSKTSVLLVGAGEMIDQCAAHFSAKKTKSIVIANRTVARGERLAMKYGGQAMTLANLPERLHEFDIVVSCTASTLPLIGLGAVESALKKRKKRPMFMLDLAVPRDIEPQIKDLKDVYLYTVDDLQGVVRQGRANRQAAVSQAETIVESGVQNFVQWLDGRNHVGLIQQLQVRTDEWRSTEIARAQRLLMKGESMDQVLESLSRGIVNKLMHGVMGELHASQPADRALLTETLGKMFLGAKCPHVSEVKSITN
jgi:glutamyl-tRNA reductase